MSDLYLLLDVYIYYILAYGYIHWFQLLQQRPLLRVKQNRETGAPEVIHLVFTGCGWLFFARDMHQTNGFRRKSHETLNSLYCRQEQMIWAGYPTCTPHGSSPLKGIGLCLFIDKNMSIRWRRSMHLLGRNVWFQSIAVQTTTIQNLQLKWDYKNERYRNFLYWFSS